MPVYTNNKFKGFFPIGTAAVVVADNRQEAAQLLNEALIKRRLLPTAESDQFDKIKIRTKGAIILHDGDY